MKEYQLKPTSQLDFNRYEFGCTSFFKCFKPTSNPADSFSVTGAFPFAADQIQLQNLVDMENDLILEEALLGRNDGEFFRGVIISYGLVDRTIKLIYQPVYADLTNIIEFPGSFVMKFVFSPLSKKPRYYVWDGGARGWNGNLSASDIETWQNNYQKIYISRDSSINLKPFVFGMRDSDDARGVFFSFQEIRQFFPYATTPMNTPINVTNIAEVDNGIYKHSIAFCDKIPGSPNDGTAVSANFGTLCPPGNGSVMVSSSSSAYSFSMLQNPPTGGHINGNLFDIDKNLLQHGKYDRNVIFHEKIFE